jgi:hypothetical protein
MLTWLYDIFVAIVSFVMSFFGIDLKKRSVSFASDVKEEEEKKADEVKVDDVAPVSTVVAE